MDGSLINKQKNNITIVKYEIINVILKLLLNDILKDKIIFNNLPPSNGYMGSRLKSKMVQLYTVNKLL